MIVFLKCKDGIIQRFHVNPKNADRWKTKEVLL